MTARGRDEDEAPIEAARRAAPGRAPWLAVLLVCVSLATFVGWEVGRREPRPASYRDLFERVARGVVGVQVDTEPPRQGTGFVVGRGEVVTARHLVVGVREVNVRVLDGRVVPAEVVGTDARNDLALLRMDDTSIPPLPLGDGGSVRVGDPVVSVGNPYGLAHTLSAGVVGQLGRRLAPSEDDGPRVGFIQLSLPLNPGNSGGPVFDARGDVVAVLSGTHAQGQAIAFAVPVEALVESLPQLRAGSHVSRAFLGLRTELRDGMVVVASVIPSSPADSAGIRAGDALSAVDGVTLRSPAELQAVLDRLPGGAMTSVRLLRDGQLEVLDVELGDWAEQPVVVGGMTLRPAPGSGGRVVAVRPRSRADRAGVRVGDLVRAVDGQPVQAPPDIKAALDERGATQLDLLRDGQPLLVRLGEPG